MNSRDEVHAEQADATAAAGAMAPPGMQTPVQHALWLQRCAGNRATTRALARTVELRKPGGKWPSAYDRKAELVSRINAQGLGVLYTLENDQIKYRVMIPSDVNHFDKKMIEFIGAGDVIPLLLVSNEARTLEGYTSGTGTQSVSFQKRVLVDSFAVGVFDLDDMLRSTDESFQLNMIHVLTERLFVKDYEKKFPKNQLGASFHGGHEAALTAELEHLRDMFGDPSIEYVGEMDDTTYATGNQYVAKIVKGSGTSRFVYKSKDEGYEIVHELTTSLQGEQAGALYVTKKDEKKRMPVQEFLEQRGTT